MFFWIFMNKNRNKDNIHENFGESKIELLQLW